MDNTIKNVLFAFQKDLTALSQKDPETYAKLIYNQDQLVEMTLSDFKTVVLRLASRSGFRQKSKVDRWFSERESGTKDFMDTMREQQDLLRKVVDP
jgi:flagellar capping protein FliD